MPQLHLPSGMAYLGKSLVTHQPFGFMQWIKLIGGSLGALFLLFAAGLCATILIKSPNPTQSNLRVLGSIALVAGGLSIGLAVYLWRSAWRRSSEAVESPALTDQATAPTPALRAEEATVTPPAEEMGNAEERPRLDPANAASAEPAPDEPEPTPRLGPDERPWEVREAWRDATLTTTRGSHEEGNYTVGLIGGVLFVGIAVWIGIAEPTKWPLAAICAAAGTLVLALVGYRMWRRRRFGETTFDMDTRPGVLGGPLCGVLHTGVSAQDAPDDGFHVKLSCYRRRITRDSDGNRQVNQMLLWRDEKQMMPFSPSVGTTLDVPVVFEIPDGLPASTPEKTANRCMWTVEVAPAVPGVDYRAMLEIPVFPVVDDDSAPVEAYRRHVLQHSAETPLSRGITVEQPRRGQLDVTFGRARRPGVASLVTGLGVGILALTWVAVAGGALFWAIVLGLAGVLFIWGALHYWTYQSSITVDGETIRVRSGVIGCASEIAIPCDALEAATLSASGSDSYTLYLDCNRAVKSAAQRRTMMRKLVRSLSGSQPPGGGSWDAYMKRYGLTDDRVTAATMITDHQAAEWIASQIEEAAAENARFA